MNPRYRVIIFTPQELNHSSYVQTGLFELEAQGLITVEVKLYFQKNRGMFSVSEKGEVTESGRPFPKASFYEVLDLSTDKSIRFVTDLYDHAEHFSKAGLEEADFYFKRSYEPGFSIPIEEETGKKVLPLGLCFGTHSEHKKDWGTFKKGLFLSNLRLNTKKDRFFLSRLLKTWKAQERHWKFINTSRKIDRFQAMERSDKQTILFQTRCFTPEADPDVLGIHRQRHRIIKLLRKEFPDTFKGGFIPSPIATKNYADALTNVPSAPEEYLDALKQAKIVIYTRGLANSPAWKMAEYCSQGKVIIAEPLTTELPVPLEEGKEVLYFHNDQELVEKIKQVMADEELAVQLSENARRYFEQHIHPVQNVRRILELMLNKSLEL